MSKKRTIQRNSDRKRSKPKFRFNVGMLIIIFAFSFIGCFLLYMVAANTNENFLSEEFKNEIIKEESMDDKKDDISTSVAEESSDVDVPSLSVTNPVPQSAAVDLSYLESCCMITDSTLLEMKNKTSFKDVLGSAELNAVSVNKVKIESNYGTITPYEAMKLKKPMNIYIMLGSDIGTSSMDEMISNYTEFVNSLKASLTDSNIYIMQLPPVITGGTVTNEMINEYNTKLLELANNSSVYCIDTNTALKTVDGNLAEEYWSTETNSFTEKVYNEICGYILTHTV